MKYRLLLTAAAIALAGSTFAAPANAARWCSVQNLGDLSENCHFQSRRQCQASLTGTMDFCRPYAGGHRHPRETYGNGPATWR